MDIFLTTCLSLAQLVKSRDEATKTAANTCLIIVLFLGYVMDVQSKCFFCIKTNKWGNNRSFARNDVFFRKKIAFYGLIELYVVFLIHLYFVNKIVTFVH